MNASHDPTPAGRLHDLLRPEILAAFDRAFFEREGYWVWERHPDRRRATALDGQPAKATNG